MSNLLGYACILDTTVNISDLLEVVNRLVRIDGKCEPSSDIRFSDSPEPIMIDATSWQIFPADFSTIWLTRVFFPIYKLRKKYIIFLSPGVIFPLADNSSFTHFSVQAQLAFEQIMWIFEQSARWIFVQEPYVLDNTIARLIDARPILSDTDSWERKDTQGIAPEVLHDQSQRNAILTGSGPVRIAAPPGSGKTRVITARIAVLLNRNINPESILVLAFNERARSELIDRLANMNIPIAKQFHQTGVHVHTFNSFGHQLLITTTSLCFQPPEHECWKTLLLDTAEAVGFKKEIIQNRSIQMAISKIRRDLINPDDIHIEFETIGQKSDPFQIFYEMYSQLQIERGIFNYDDQIYLTVKLLVANRSVRSSFQHRFTHVLVDELQDLNASQMLMTDIISRPQWNVFAVGDDDQMIYGWRGADISVMLGFQERFAMCECRNLETNYRSGSSIIAGANRLIQFNRHRVAKRIIPRTNAPTGMVHLLCATSAWDQMQKIASLIANELNGTYKSGNGIAILCRYNAQIPMIQTVLLLNELSFFPLKFRIFQSDHCKLIVKRIMTNAKSSALPWPQCIVRDAMILCSSSDVGNQETENIEQESISDSHPSIINNLLFEIIAISDSAENFYELVSQLEDREVSMNRSISDSIRISTIHSVKGREFDHVIMFNAARMALESDQIEEERRVFYVAVTRAIRRLTITYPLHNASRFLMEMSIKTHDLHRSIENWNQDISRKKDEISTIEKCINRIQQLARLVNDLCMESKHQDIADFWNRSILRDTELERQLRIEINRLSNPRNDTLIAATRTQFRSIQARRFKAQRRLTLLLSGFSNHQVHWKRASSIIYQQLEFKLNGLRNRNLELAYSMDCMQLTPASYMPFLEDLPTIE